MLEAGVEAAEGRVGLLAVTVLTHLDAEDLELLGWPGADPATIAERWGRLARDAGCTGVVCSAQELCRLRPVLPRPFLLVTPGIRPQGEAARDQRRISTPGEALARGSDLLVVGRPLTQAADPEAALEALAAELRAAESEVLSS
jgi:orotidine-5'-phosphate decarboxylase